MEVVANDLFPDPQYAAEAGIAYVPLDDFTPVRTSFRSTVR